MTLLIVPLIGKIAKSERAKLRTIQAMFLGYAVATCGITLTKNLYVVCALSMLTGLTNTVAFGSLRSFFSVGVSSNKQGRVLSALTFIENAVGLLSPLVFNSMLQYTGGKTLFWLIAAIVAVCGFLLGLVEPRSSGGGGGDSGGDDGGGSYGGRFSSSASRYSSNASASNRRHHIYEDDQVGDGDGSSDTLARRPLLAPARGGVSSSSRSSIRIDISPAEERCIGSSNSSSSRTSNNRPQRDVCI